MKIQINIKYDSVKEQSIEKEVKSQNALFKEIGKAMYNFHLNNRHISSLTIEALDEEKNEIANFYFSKRGTYILDGTKYPSLHCTSQYVNDVLPFRKYNAKDLRCINLDGNNYKKYILDEVNNKDEDLHIRYGSIDVISANCREVVYPNYMFWILYYEKLSKGYKDFSSIINAHDEQVEQKQNLDEEENSTKNNNYENTNLADKELYDLLYAFSKNFVREVLTTEKVTQKQCEKAEKLFEELKNKKTVKGFNTCLTKLMVISPRRRNPMNGDKISDYCADSVSDFQNIIDFEETLLNSMKTICGKKVEPKKIIKGSFLSEFDIEIHDATQEQKDIVMKHLNYSLQSKVQKIYRVIPKEQKNKFDNYCQTNKINKIKLLWHGSPNANWYSILANSLKITRNATHGRMFGDGIYFAPSADKSWGYTSSWGSRWANGNSNTAIMGLYATAYGNPYMVQSWGAQENEASIKAKGCNCLHATSANTGLRADEIIYYNENAICLNYIVIFQA